MIVKAIGGKVAGPNGTLEHGRLYDLPESAYLTMLLKAGLVEYVEDSPPAAEPPEIETYTTNLF